MTQSTEAPVLIRTSLLCVFVPREDPSIIEYSDSNEEKHTEFSEAIITVALIVSKVDYHIFNIEIHGSWGRYDYL